MFQLPESKAFSRSYKCPENQADRKHIHTHCIQSSNPPHLQPDYLQCKYTVARIRRYLPHRTGIIQMMWRNMKHNLVLHKQSKALFSLFSPLHLHTHTSHHPLSGILLNTISRHFDCHWSSYRTQEHCRPSIVLPH